MANLRIRDDHVRILKGICLAFGSVTSVDQLNQALERWLRIALRARTFSHALFAPDRSSNSLELIVLGGTPRPGANMDANRRQAFIAKSAVRAPAEESPWETVLLLPMITSYEAYGVLELTAPTAAIDGAIETLEAIAAQAAIVLRHLRHVSMLSDEIEEAYKVNEVREERLSTGIALTAHEIKSPLLGTLAVMQVIEQMGADQQVQLLREAQKQLEDLAALTDELLRTTFGPDEISLAPILLGEVVNEAIAALPEEDRDRVAVYGSHGGVAGGDLLQLRNALRHVIRHALRHTAKDEVVALRMTHNDSSSCLTITDGGPRIPDDERDNLFDPFARDRRGVRSMDALSLFAARRIVEAHGGKIVVDSDESGTSFTLEIPLATKEAQSVLS